MTNEVCANCGIAAIDNVALKKCGGCELVKYCGIECQKNHRPQHKKACKKRMAEIREDRLFTQPDESHLGECPICCLPLDCQKPAHCKVMTCCSKLICIGCCYAALDEPLDVRCPFCRVPAPKTDEEMKQNRMKRVEANDPLELSQIGDKCLLGGDYEKAFEYLSKAAGLGNMDAHYNLSVMYQEGTGVKKDLKKEMRHLEEAAIGGHPVARYNLGVHEDRRDNPERAVKHFVISAKLGYDGALEAIKKWFADGFVSKEDYEAALRGHQAAVDATKSLQRDVAQKFYRVD